MDPAPAMIEVAKAKAKANDERLRFSAGTAEQLPYPDGSFDIVVSTTSFDHWSDQQAGLEECFRVTRPGGRLTLVDQFSTWLIPTLLFGRRDKARTQRRANRLALESGYRSLEWHDVYAVIIKALTAMKEY